MAASSRMAGYISSVNGQCSGTAVSTVTFSRGQVTLCVTVYTAYTHDMAPFRVAIVDVHTQSCVHHSETVFSTAKKANNKQAKREKRTINRRRLWQILEPTHSLQMIYYATDSWYHADHECRQASIHTCSKVSSGSCTYRRSWCPAALAKRAGSLPPNPYRGCRRCTRNK